MTMSYFSDAWTTSTGDIAKKDVMREVLYIEADTMMNAQNGLVIRPTPVLDIRMLLPKTTRIDPTQISEGALAPQSTLEFRNVDTSLEKYQTRLPITYEVKARQLGKEQVRGMLKASARGLAYSKDTEAFTEIAAGADAGGAVTATDAWDETSSADIPDDIATGVQNIVDGTNITEEEIKDIVCFYPMKMKGFLLKNGDLGQMDMSIQSWIENNLGIKMYPTRQLSKTAIMMVKSEETAIHWVYNGEDVPTAEERKVEGVGDEYIFTQYYKTKVIPDTDGGTTTGRIITITGVDD